MFLPLRILNYSTIIVGIRDKIMLIGDKNSNEIKSLFKIFAPNDNL